MASISFVPMCTNCKQIIWDVIDYKEAYRQPDVLGGARYFKDHEISPERCPNCGKIFESIEVPTKIPYDNRLNCFLNGDSEQ